MSEEIEQPKKKSRPLKKLVLILLGVLVVGGGGAGAGLYAMGSPWLPGGGAAGDPNRPKLVPRPDASRSAVAEATAKAERGRPDPRVFQPSYLPLENSFTSNLRGGDAFVQIGIGVSTFYDERVFANVKAHEMAIRSAILMTLADRDSLALSTASGKAELRESLKNAVNGVLTDKEGFGGIDEVYFTSFVTQ
jgi:flagellar protein FliL